MQEMQLGGRRQNQRSVWRAIGRWSHGDAARMLPRAKLFRAFLKWSIQLLGMREEIPPSSRRRSAVPTCVICHRWAIFVVSKFMIVHVPRLRSADVAHIGIWAADAFLVRRSPPAGQGAGGSLQWALKILSASAGETERPFYMPRRGGTASASSANEPDEAMTRGLTTRRRNKDFALRLQALKRPPRCRQPTHSPDRQGGELRSSGTAQPASILHSGRFVFPCDARSPPTAACPYRAGCIPMNRPN